MRLRHVALLAVLVTSGCAVRAGTLAAPSPWPVTSGGATSATLGVTGDVLGNGKPSLNNPEFAMWKAQAQRAYQESGLFSEVRQDTSEADYHVRVKVHQEIETNSVAMAFSLLTFLMSPTRSSGTYTLTTTVTDRNGDEIFRSSVKEEYAVWVQLFALVGAGSNGAVRTGIVYDLNRAAIAEAAAKGVYRRAGA